MEPRETRTRAVAELSALLAAAAIHVTLEEWRGPEAARIANAVLVLLFSGYVLRRLRGSAERARRDGLLPLRPSAAASLETATLGLLATALLAWPAETARSASVTTAALGVGPTSLYLLYGIAQQYALQNLVARNLAALWTARWPSALLTGGCFGAAHLPRQDLALFCVLAGFVLTLFHRRHGNLWLTGALHGVWGTLLFHSGWLAH